MTSHEDRGRRPEDPEFPSDRTIDVDRPLAAEPEVPEATVAIAGQDLPLSQAIEIARRNARWFYWVAGLSLINSVSAFFAWDLVMIVGLGVTQLVDGFAMMFAEDGEAARRTASLFSLAFAVGAATVCVLLGRQAMQIKIWPYWVGIGLYAMDALIFLAAGDLLGLAFHGFVLFCLLGGASVTRKITAARPGPHETLL